MTPLVSIIIPNYNHAAYLQERIESVLGQTYTDFEIIILDDHSTDNSLDIIQPYRHHPKVAHVIINPENTGRPFLQWSKGISLARGKYIWIAESDDVADPHLLESLVTAISQESDIAVAFAHSRLIDQDGKDLPHQWHKDHSGKVLTFSGQEFVIQKMLTSNYIYNASMALFRRSAYDAIPTDYQQFRYCGDWAFWIHLCLQGRVVEVCSILNAYRQHTGQTTRKSVKTGGKWMEVGSIIRNTAHLLKLSTFKHRCLRGRYTKHFKKESVPNREEILTHYQDIFGGSFLDICCYEIGKFFGFLK